MAHRGVARTHRGVAWAHRGVALTHRGVARTHRDVALTHRGVAWAHRGVASRVRRRTDGASFCRRGNSGIFHRKISIKPRNDEKG